MHLTMRLLLLVPVLFSSACANCCKAADVRCALENQLEDATRSSNAPRAVLESLAVFATSDDATLCAYAPEVAAACQGRSSAMLSVALDYAMRAARQCDREVFERVVTACSGLSPREGYAGFMRTGPAAFLPQTESRLALAWSVVSGPGGRSLARTSDAGALAALGAMRGACADTAARPLFSRSYCDGLARRPSGALASSPNAPTAAFASARREGVMADVEACFIAESPGAQTAAQLARLADYRECVHAADASDPVAGVIDHPSGHWEWRDERGYHTKTKTHTHSADGSETGTLIHELVATDGTRMTIVSRETLTQGGESRSQVDVYVDGILRETAQTKANGDTYAATFDSQGQPLQEQWTENQGGSTVSTTVEYEDGQPVKETRVETTENADGSTTTTTTTTDADGNQTTTTETEPPPPSGTEVQPDPTGVESACAVLLTGKLEGARPIPRGGGVIDPGPLDVPPVDGSCFDGLLDAALGYSGTSKCTASIYCPAIVVDETCTCGGVRTPTGGGGVGRCAMTDCGGGASCDGATGLCRSPQGGLSGSPVTLDRVVPGGLRPMTTPPLRRIR